MKSLRKIRTHLLVTNIIIATSIFFQSFGMDSKSEISSADEQIIEQGIALPLSSTETIVSDEVMHIRDEAFEQVKKGKYPAAIGMILKGLEKFPKDFGLQSDLASLLGDTSKITPSPLKERMLRRAKELFDKLEKEAVNQPKEIYYPFKNEYFFRFGLYKEQYELGIERAAYYWGLAALNPSNYSYNGHGYYSQGVGAARYARKLVEQGKKALAIEYAQKAIVSWAQYFSYEHDYYNAYVHYALALGILGHKEEMMRTLSRSAAMLKRDFDYFEFKEVIDFVNSLD